MDWIRRRSPFTRLVHALLLSGLVGAFAYVCPTPFWLQAPGPIYEVERLVRIQGESPPPATGKFLLPTVVSEPATLLYCVYGLFSPGAELSRKGASPRAQTAGDDGDEQMSLSQTLAIEAAFTELARLDRGRIQGLEVVELLPNSPNRNLLQDGDLMLELGGRPLRHGLDIMLALRGRTPGGSIPLLLIRSGRRLRIDLTVWQVGPRPVLGVRFRPGLLRGGVPTEVEIASEHVSGASGGLVFCLEILDRLDARDLTRGRRIAATGTLDWRGRVGAIEGVRFKLSAVERAGADLLLCPRENLAELDGRSSKVRVVGVDSLQEALQALGEEKGGSAP